MHFVNIYVVKWNTCDAIHAHENLGGSLIVCLRQQGPCEEPFKGLRHFLEAMIEDL